VALADGRRDRDALPGMDYGLTDMDFVADVDAEREAGLGVDPRPSKSDV